MGPRVCTFALLVLLLVAAGDAHHKSSHAARHGGRAIAAHRTAKATPLARTADKESTGKESAHDEPKKETAHDEPKKESAHDEPKKETAHDEPKKETAHDEPKKETASDEPKLETLKATKEIEFDFGDDGTIEKELKASGRYDPKMVSAYDMTLDDQERNRIILTTPLARRGIPVTLSTIPFDGKKNPLLKPYPNFEIHRTTEDTITDCNTQLVDVIRTTKTWADDSTLYALDNGVLDVTTNPKNVCPPKIVIFDLRKDEITSTVIIKNAACNALYTTLWVDVCPDGCLTAYASDTRGNVLTVTNLTAGESKHLHSQYFYPKPGFFFTAAGGPPYYLPNGLDGVTAGQTCDGKLYMQAFASNVQCAVDKQVIQDASDGDVLDLNTQVNLPGELPGTSGQMLVGPEGEYLFFPVLDELAMYCWNTSKPHDPQNFHLIVQDSERLQFVSSIALVKSIKRLYVMSNKFTSYLSNTTNYSKINYQISYIDLKDTEC